MSVLSRIARRLALRGVDEDTVRERVESVSDEKSPKHALVQSVSKRAAIRAFFAGLPGGLWALPLGLIDASSALRGRVELAASLHALADEEFLEGDEWKQRTLESAYDLPPEALSTRPLATKALRDALMTRAVRVASSRVASKLVPVAGGFVSATWAYAWTRREGRRLAEAI